MGRIILALLFLPLFCWGEQIDPQRDNLVASWHLNENTGAYVQDSTNRGHSGVISGGATWTTGLMGSALQFTTDGTVSVGDSTDWLQNRLTAMAWIKRDAYGAQHIVGQWDAAGNQRSWQLTSTGDNIQFCTSQDGQDGTSICLGAGTGLPEDDRWHHVAATYRFVADNTSIGRLYVDGEFTFGRGTLRQLHDSTGDLTIGRHNAAEPFEGKIEEVKIFNVEMSTGQVRGYFSRGRRASSD